MSANPESFSPALVEAEYLRRSLRRFAKAAWPHFDSNPLVWNWHLDALCDHLQHVTMGHIRFLMINMPPRTSKSSVTSVIWPVWEWLTFPHLQYITASYALQLSTRDALKSRRLIDSPWFQARWGHRFRFAFDEKLKRQYSNDKGGRRIATAVDSAVTGEGGNRIIVDDPHNAKEVESEVIRLGASDWWDNAMSSRLNNPDTDAWVVNGQRTHESDLFGHILRTHDRREIVQLVLPNEFEARRRCVTFLPGTKKEIFRDPRAKDGELLCEARIPAKASRRLKKVMRAKYTLQYQQNPKAGAGNILLREHWRLWEGAPPEVDSILSIYDTAYGEKQENDYSARTDWGIFRFRDTRKIPVWTDSKGHQINPDQDPDVLETAGTKERMGLILLGAWRGKIAYPDLRKRALAHWRKRRPDYLLIENKGSGISLAQDLGRLNVTGIRKIKIDHGGRVKIDKVERANIASVVLSDGLVFYVERDWSEMVIAECASFPNGQNDDLVDTALMAFQWLRRLGEAHLWEEEDPDDNSVRLFKRAKRPLYG